MANNDNFDQGVELTKIASIDDVFLALRTTFMGSQIEVTTEDGRTFKLSIQGLYHEDGSGRSLVISGYGQLVRTPKMKINGLGSKRFEAYLNYKGGSRKGWIRLEKDITLVQRATAHRRAEGKIMRL